MDCLYIYVFDIYRPKHINGPMMKKSLYFEKLIRFLRLESLFINKSYMKSLWRCWMHVFQRCLLSSLLTLLSTRLRHLDQGGWEVVSWYLPRSSSFLCPTPEFRLQMRKFFLASQQTCRRVNIDCSEEAINFLFVGTRSETTISAPPDSVSVINETIPSI